MEVSGKSDSVLDWLRGKIEFGAIVSALIAVATYVGNFYYKSYFDFYFIDSADIAIPVANSIRSFIIILIISGTLVYLVASAEIRKQSGFRAALLENIPLFMGLFLLCILAIDIYWSNVTSLSAWLGGSLRDGGWKETNRELTLKVTRFLKWAILIVPPVFATLTVLILSLKKFSFSGFLLKRSIGFRLIVLAIYVLSVLSLSSSYGRLVAFLEHTGAIRKPAISITLEDGKTFQEGSSLYLIVKSDGVFYLAARSGDPDANLKTWQVPQSMVKNIELQVDSVDPKPFLNYLGMRKR